MCCSGSRHAAPVSEKVASPSPHPLLNFFLRAKLAPVASVVAMCMVIINTHMLIHVSIE